MAVYKRDMVDINLETGNIHRSFLKHSIGYKDQQADHFGIRAYRNGEPVNLTGVSIQGIFMPPQGSPIAITSGNIVNYNEAEVVLPQACYNYDGQFTLAIKLVDPSNAVTGTMRIVDGMVDNTHASGTVAPTAAVPGYEEVLATYEQAIAAINKTVRFDATQSLTDTQKATARSNISAPSVAEMNTAVGNEATARQNADALKVNISDIENDLTGTTAGKVLDARQGKVLDDKITAEAATRAAADSDLKSALAFTKKDIAGTEGGEGLSFTEGGYIKTSGSTADITSVVTDSSFAYAVMDCQAGDVIVTRGKGGSDARLWAFLDSSGNVLSKSGSGANQYYTEQIAPTNAVKVVMNCKISDGYFGMKGHSAKYQMIQNKRTLVFTGNNCINVDYVNMKIMIPAGYINQQNAQRVQTSSAELSFGNYYYFLYYDFFNNTYVLKKFTESADLTNLIFVAMIPSGSNGNADGIPMANVPIAINGTIINRSVGYERAFAITQKQAPIIINERNRTIIFNGALYINYQGTNYNIPNNNGVVVDYKGNSDTKMKRVYFDTSKLSSAVSNGLSSDCFYVAEQTSPASVSENYVLIALIPDKSYQYNIRPYAIFDYITNEEESRSALFAEGFVPSAPTVHALYGEGAPVNATAYDQLNTIIALWDSLLSRANQYGTYMKKCWADGTDYDNTNKTMSSQPTSGDHNPRGDMNQYPIIMYKLIPNRYTNPSGYKNEPTKRRVLITSGIHGAGTGGDQLESPMAIYYMAKRIVEEFYLTDSLFNIRNNVELDIIPVMNPWGVNNKTRANGQGIDINRDFESFQTAEGQYIKTLVESGVYDMYWDSHCLGQTDLTGYDLTHANYIWDSAGETMNQFGFQLMNFIGAKYSVLSERRDFVMNSAAWYANSIGVPSFLTEVPANCPLYYGDTTGDAHGEEVMRHDADFTQNVIAVMCNALTKWFVW